MTTKNSEIETIKPEEIANTSLVTIDPPTFVAAVFEPFYKRLELANASTKDSKYDVTTTAGLDVAKKNRALYRDIRIQSETERKSRKAPIITIGKLLDTECEKIELLVRPHESKFDTEIKAEEERKENEKAEKLRIEEERKSILDDKINAIKNAPLLAMNMSAEKTQELIDELSNIMPTSENYEERYVEAETLLAVSIASLKSLHLGKVAIEQQTVIAAEADRQQEAQRKADEEANQERARIDGIKTKIQSIKNAVIDGAECESSASLQSIIDKVQAIATEGFSEFFNEAEQTKASTISSLNRQMKFVLSEEAASLESRRIEDQLVENTKPMPVVESSSAPIVESVTRHIDSVGEPAKHTITEPAKQYFDGIKPTDAEIIQTLSDIYKCDPLRVLDWISEIDIASNVAFYLKKKSA